MKENINRSFGLDLIRALAVSLVLLAHFAKTVELLGFWGVELFFALSGFLIGKILWISFSQSEHWSFSHLKNFWLRRWWRTLPNYYLFLVISLVYQYNSNDLPSFEKLSDFFWFGQNLLSRYGGFYGVSWSLCIEEWFYLIFPLILFTLYKFGFKKHHSFILTLLIFFIGSAVIRNWLILDGQGDSLRTITFSRLDSIAYGVAASYITTVLEITYLKRLQAFIIGVLLLLSPVFIAYLSSSTFHDLRQSALLLITVPIGASSILPFLSTLATPPKSLNFITKGIQKLSLWSYSIYLSHIPVLFTIYFLLNNIRDNVYGNLLSKIIGLALTLIISGLIFKYFEIPITKKRPPNFIR